MLAATTIHGDHKFTTIIMPQNTHKMYHAHIKNTPTHLPLLQDKRGIANIPAQPYNNHHYSYPTFRTMRRNFLPEL